jgi:acylphosphatase
MSGEAQTITRVVIVGRVQRVGYRAWTERTAIELDLAGWVRNRLDGSVEAVFAGEVEVVTQMIDACRAGPPKAMVERIDHRDVAPDDLDRRYPGERFSVLPTE